MAYRYKTSINFNGYQFGNGYSYILWAFAEPAFFSGIFNNLGELIDSIIENLPSNLGASILSYNLNGNILNITIETDTYYPNEPTGDLIGLRFFDSNESVYISKWIQFESELCPTCQDVTMDNCNSVIFEAAILDGTYEVRILDNQSGVFYYQNIEFTGSQGTWDQTNTTGVFTPFSVYTVTILDNNGDPVSWVDGTNEYNCMRLTFNTFTDTTPEG